MAKLRLFISNYMKSTKTTLPNNMTPETNTRFCVPYFLHEKVISAEKLISCYINPKVNLLTSECNKSQAAILEVQQQITRKRRIDCH